MKPSTARCLSALRAAHGWVSGTTLFEASGTRYGARVYELRASGFVIERRPARNGSAVPEYRLVEPPRQLTLEGVAS